jgi:O-antigen ligase
MIDQVFVFLVGIGLAAAVGLRIFIPILVVSIFAYTGNLTLSTYFTWIGYLPILILLIILSIIEVIAYYVVWLDNYLDAIEHPLSIISGIIIIGAVITEFNPYLKWLLALLIGGAVSGTINASTSLIRLKISAETGGSKNFILSTTEAVIAVILSITSIYYPFIAGLITALAIIYFTFIIRKKFLSPAEDES